MKTGKHYFGLLTEEEQRNFRQACEEQEEDFDIYMIERFKSFEKFIFGAFIWGFTPEKQGYEYWETIANSNRDGNNN